MLFEEIKKKIYPWKKWIIDREDNLKQHCQNIEKKVHFQLAMQGFPKPGSEAEKRSEFPDPFFTSYYQNMPFLKTMWYSSTMQVLD